MKKLRNDLEQLGDHKSNINKSGFPPNPSTALFPRQFNNLKPNNNNLNDITNFTVIIPDDQARQINMKHLSSQADELEIHQYQQYFQLQPPQKYIQQDQIMAQMHQNGDNNIYNGKPSVKFKDQVAIHGTLISKPNKSLPN